MKKCFKNPLRGIMFMITNGIGENQEFQKLRRKEKKGIQPEKTLDG